MTRGRSLNARFLALPLMHGGRSAGYGVYMTPASRASEPLEVYAGLFAASRARRHAARLNRKGKR